MDAANTSEGIAAALALCTAWERLLDSVAPEWPGGPADIALERVRGRIDAIIAPPAAGEDQGGGISIRCLGPLSVRASGVEIEWPRRARLVFMYLLVHRHRPVMRDELIEAFWPGAEPDNGRNCLNVTLTQVRRPFRAALGEVPVILFRSEAYRINPDIRLSLDWDDLNRLTAAGDEHFRAGRDQEAIACYRAALDLDGGRLLEDERYSPWIDPCRDTVEGTILQVLDRLAEIELRVGDHGSCIETCRRLLTLEPHREDIHRRLIEAHAALGQPALAVQQFRTCEEVLRRTLGTAPGRAIRDLIERITRAATADPNW